MTHLHDLRILITARILKLSALLIVTLAIPQVTPARDVTNLVDTTQLGTWTKIGTTFNPATGEIGGAGFFRKTVSGLTVGQTYSFSADIAPGTAPGDLIMRIGAVAVAGDNGRYIYSNYTAAATSVVLQFMPDGSGTWFISDVMLNPGGVEPYVPFGTHTVDDAMSCTVTGSSYTCALPPPPPPPPAVTGFFALTVPMAGLDLFGDFLIDSSIIFLTLGFSILALLATVALIRWAKLTL